MITVVARSTGRVVRGLIIWGVIGLLIILVGGVVTARGLFGASLPRTSGQVTVEELEGEVTIERDAVGIPVIRGASRNDLACALGFLHGQERFFQMDFMRRLAAGELAAVVGARALEQDKRVRRLRLRHLARDVVARMNDEHQGLLEAYAQGVNAGLDDLGARPPEYLALQATPESWAPEDTILVVQALTMQLSRAPGLDEMRADLHDSLASELVEFITPATTRFDSPLEGRAIYSPAPVPGPEVVDAGTLAMGAGARPIGSTGAAGDQGERVLGSNNWAISGRLTDDGRAILASDPHLGYGVPGVWYRAQLEESGADGLRRVVGVTIPGAPIVVIGSNGSVAWGMTNVHGDFDDDIIVEVDPEDDSRYRTPSGWVRFKRIEETIEVAGGQSEPLEIKQTVWGPVWRTDRAGRPIVLRWTGSTVGLVNLELIDMGESETLESAMGAAARWWGPPQNIVIADDEGRVAMVMSGYLPERAGLDGRRPASWAEPGVGWVGSLEDDARPSIVDPERGFVYSANARVFDANVAESIGAHWPMGVRATRIRQMLEAESAFDEASMFEAQLDTRVLLLEAYREILLAQFDEDDQAGEAGRIGNAVATLRSEALAADSANRAVTIMDAYMREVVSRMHAIVETMAREHVDGLNYWWFADDEWILRVLEEAPAHWLPAGSEDWESWHRSCLADALDRVDGDRAQWGEHSPFVFRHPLSRAVAALGAGLDMADRPGAGHGHAVRAHTRAYGASMRMVVSPGQEENGILHMPCGQSGHFLSRHYGDMHDQWASGVATPLLAGETVSTFRLAPAP